MYENPTHKNTTHLLGTTVAYIQQNLRAFNNKNIGYKNDNLTSNGIGTATGTGWYV